MGLLIACRWLAVCSVYFLEQEAKVGNSKLDHKANLQVWRHPAPALWIFGSFDIFAIFGGCITPYTLIYISRGVRVASRRHGWLNLSSLLSTRQLISPNKT